MRTIGIDCRFAATSSGIGRYTRELVTALVARNAMHYVLFVRSTDEPWIPPVSDSVSIIEASFPHYSFAEHTRFPSLLKTSKIDLFFSPHFNVPWFCPVPFVATIHDLILHRFPNNANLLRQLAYRSLLGRTVWRASRLIGVSRFTADELRSAYGERVASKVDVIHEAVSPMFSPVDESVRSTALRRHGLSKPYFLYVGNAKQHKNVQLLIDAFSFLHDPTQELVLICGGKEADRLRLAPGVRLLRDVPDADLPALYAAARCFVSASLYEGFGLPLLEAYACGCPAIVSNCGSFPEIAPPGTMLIDPTPEVFMMAMRTPPQRMAVTKIRSWEEVAAETEAVLLREGR